MRPYIAETEASKLKRPDFPHGEDSWSPQPFRMASSGSPAKDIRRETFISSKKEAFDESNVNKENISSPRRDTFIVPKGLAISDETITIRRETFVSVNPRPMLTSTPRIGGGGQGSQVELVSKELNHFGVIADLFRQIGGHSSRFVLFCSF